MREETVREKGNCDGAVREGGSCEGGESHDGV